MNNKQHSQNHQALTQKQRVIAVATGNQWLTLADIEKRIQSRFGKHDKQTAISARLREVSPILHGVVKEINTTKNEATGNRCWFYRLKAVK